jgi:hypothetical protein
MRTQDDSIIAGKIILVFVFAALLYFGLGSLNWPITEIIRD